MAEFEEQISEKFLLGFFGGGGFLRSGFFFFRRDVNGIGFVQALLEIADGKSQPPADLGNLPPPEKQEDDGENYYQLCQT